MPNNATGRIDDHPLRIQKVKLKISSELKNKGRQAMTDPVTGFVPTDDQLQFAEVLGLSIVPAAVSIPTPPVAQQGSKGSCVSFAIGYYYRSIEQYIKTGASSFNNAVNVVSPEYLFDYVQTNSCSGSTLLDNLELMQNKGICLWNTLPYTTGTCDVADASPHDTEAANYRISGYSMVLLSDRTAMKALLASKKPVYININVDSAFYGANSSFIWNATNHAGTSFVGGHAVLIVGYDDSKNAYKIVNQWGTGWGASGFSWIDYDFLETGGQCGGYGMTIDGIVSAAGLPTLPIADAGPDTTIPSTSSAILSATGSYDPNGSIASYLWSQIGGSSVTIINPTAAVASVATWAGPGTYTFKVIVTDNDGNTASATVIYTVTSVQIISISVAKKKTGKNIADVITWSISMDALPQRAELEQSWSATTNFNSIYPLPTFSGVYTTNYIDPTKTRSFRYYRLKITTAAGDTIYSEVKSIK